MFTEVIGKTCGNKDDQCALLGQMQEKGLAICPECGSELVPVERKRKDLMLATAVVGGLLASAVGLFGYGAVIQRFSPVQTVKWLLGHLQVTDRVGAPDQSWFYGKLFWDFAGPRPGHFSDHLLREYKDGQYWFRPQFVSATGDRVHFELYPQQQGYIYVFYRDDARSFALFPKDDPQATGSRLRVPRAQDVRLSGGAGTEVFVIAAARKPIPSLAALQSTELSGKKLDEIAKTVAADRECVVMVVQVPHA